MDGKQRVSVYGDVDVIEEGDGYRFLIRGELDHHSVKHLREVIDAVLVDHRPKQVIFDLNEVSFTDSAGLGLVLGRYTRIGGYGGTLRLVRVSEEFLKILRLAGVDRFLSVEGRKKEKTAPL